MTGKIAVGGITRIDKLVQVRILGARAGHGLAATALIWAAGQGHASTLEQLLENGADPNSQDGDGVTALMEAVTTKHNEIIEILLKHNADPALKDSQGRTAADIAKQKHNDEAVGFLSRR